MIDPCPNCGTRRHIIRVDEPGRSLFRCEGCNTPAEGVYLVGVGGWSRHCRIVDALRAHVDGVVGRIIAGRAR